MPDLDATTSAGPERTLAAALEEAIRQSCDPAGRVAVRVSWRRQCVMFRPRGKDRARVQAWLGPFAGGAAIPAAVQPTLVAAGWQAGELGGSGRSMFFEVDLQEAGRLAAAVEAAMVAVTEGEPPGAAPRIDLVDDRVRWRSVVGFVGVLAGLLAGTIAVIVARVPPYAGLHAWMARAAGGKAAAGAVFVAVFATLLIVLAGAAGIVGLARRGRT